MAQALPIGASDYYDFFPSSEHRVGDIWTDIPCFGMLGLEHATGIVITPACDLQNIKTETLTFLPIVTVRQTFALKGVLPSIVRTINGQAQILGISGLADSSGPFVPIKAADLDSLAADVIKKTKQSQCSQKELAAADRVTVGLSILRSNYGAPLLAPTGEQLKLLFGDTNFDALISRIVTNSHKGDMHFLPNDGQRAEWSAIQEPSTALFRYVCSAPIELFDCAQDVSRTDWDGEISRLAPRIREVDIYRARRPMKRQTLKPRFAADLLTRYVAMHVRLGAPDFTEESVRTYVASIAGAKE